MFLVAHVRLTEMMTTMDLSAVIISYGWCLIISLAKGKLCFYIHLNGKCRHSDEILSLIALEIIKVTTSGIDNKEFSLKDFHSRNLF